MRKVCIFLLALIVLSSCTKKERLLNIAKRDAKEMIEKEAMDPANFNKDIRLDEITPVYGSDSLCILYLNVKLKNLLGVEVVQRVEFIHFGDFWYRHTPDEDLGETTIFLPEESFSTEKKGMIYENYHYDDAIYYRAAFSLNKMNKEGNLDKPIKTGFWELGTYKDGFKEDTGSNYLSLSSYEGVEKNSESKVKAELIVDKNDIYFKVLKKSLGHFSPFTSYGDYAISIEKSDGKTCGPWTFFVTDKGIMPSKKRKDEINGVIKKLLEEEGKITIMATVDNFLVKSKLRFKMNLVGYLEAEKYLK